MIEFKKVSYSQFYDSYKNLNLELTPEFIEEVYDELKLPERKTIGSAGYDFVAPFSFSLAPEETILIPTGIRAIFPENVVLLIFPRSSLGFKYRAQMDNTIPVIDSDFSQSDNEGHIMLKITNDSKNGKVMEVERGKGIAQGIFLPYLITDNDNATGIRNGGIGSTDEKVKFTWDNNPKTTGYPNQKLETVVMS